MRRPLAFVALAVLAGVVLAATVFREEVAYAAQAVNATIVGPLDGGGNIKVHEQGTANVNVTNSGLSVTPQLASKTFKTELNAGAGGETAQTFPTIDASLITVTWAGSGSLRIRNGSNLLFELVSGGNAGEVATRDNVVLPFTLLLSVDTVFLECDTDCAVSVSVVGR